MKSNQVISVCQLFFCEYNQKLYALHKYLYHFLPKITSNEISIYSFINMKIRSIHNQTVVVYDQILVGYKEGNTHQVQCTCTTFTFLYTLVRTTFILPLYIILVYIAAFPMCIQIITKCHVKGYFMYAVGWGGYLNNFQSKSQLFINLNNKK